MGAIGIGGWSLVPYAAATDVGRWREIVTPTTANTTTATTMTRRRMQLVTADCSRLVERRLHGAWTEHVGRGVRRPAR